MSVELNLLGEFKDKFSENYFQDVLWQKNKNYTFLSYFLCCLFFLFAGVLGDYQRPFYFGDVNYLTMARVVLLIIAISFFAIERKNLKKPQLLEWWLGSMKLISTMIILFLTIWTKGASLTLLPGIMMMVGSFFMILPGRIHSTVLCAIILFLTFALFQEPSITFGLKIHRYMIFMLFAINILLLFFKVKADSLTRREFMTNLNLAEVNKAKDKILAALAHDIRNPLSIIQMRAERSLKKSNEFKIDFISKDQTSILHSTKKIDDLIKDLLDWALTELKQGSLVLKSVCVSSTIKHALDFLDDSIEEKKIDLEIDIEDCTFEHDPKMLATCIRNIVSNAIKFSPSSSKILVRGECLPNGHYSIHIEDCGKGMSKDLVEKILCGENFQSQKGEGGEKGMGLGLRLVHNIIKRHKGQMRIDSHEGLGTTFRLLIPILKPRKNDKLPTLV